MHGCAIVSVHTAKYSYKLHVILPSIISHHFIFILVLYYAPEAPLVIPEEPLKRHSPRGRRKTETVEKWPMHSLLARDSLFQRHEELEQNTLLTQSRRIHQGTGFPVMASGLWNDLPFSMPVTDFTSTISVLTKDMSFLECICRLLI